MNMVVMMEMDGIEKMKLQNQHQMFYARCIYHTLLHHGLSTSDLFYHINPAARVPVGGSDRPSASSDSLAAFAVAHQEEAIRRRAEVERCGVRVPLYSV